MNVKIENAHSSDAVNSIRVGISSRRAADGGGSPLLARSDPGRFAELPGCVGGLQFLPTLSWWRSVNGGSPLFGFSPWSRVSSLFVESLRSREGGLAAMLKCDSGFTRAREASTLRESHRLGSATQPSSGRDTPLAGPGAADYPHAAPGFFELIRAAAMVLSPSGFASLRDVSGELRALRAPTVFRKGFSTCPR
ncbi:MAG: hypothetical protein HZA51_15600 [Planctomycetes bacterium]|nr:hypothetical protein [Planctomycetota bacterium]